MRFNSDVHCSYPPAPMLQATVQSVGGNSDSRQNNRTYALATASCKVRLVSTSTISLRCSAEHRKSDIGLEAAAAASPACCREFRCQFISP